MINPLKLSKKELEDKCFYAEQKPDIGDALVKIDTYSWQYRINYKIKYTFIIKIDTTTGLLSAQIYSLNTTLVINSGGNNEEIIMENIENYQNLDVSALVKAYLKTKHEL